MFTKTTAPTVHGLKTGGKYLFTPAQGSPFGDKPLVVTVICEVGTQVLFQFTSVRGNKAQSACSPTSLTAISR